MPSWEKQNCTSGSANQGFGKCVTEYGQLTYMLAIPKGTKVTAAQLADLETTVKTKTADPNPALRWYLLGPFPTFSQANTEAQSQKAGNGLERMTSVGFFGWNLELWSGGFCGYKNLLKMHQSQDRFDFLNIHGGKQLAGVYFKDSTGEYMKGISMMQVFVPNWGMSDGGSNGTKYAIDFKVGDSAQLRDNYTSTPITFDIASVATSLIDVVLSAANSAANTYDVSAVTGCGGEDLSVLYPTELAAVGAWKATNAETGADVTITSVTLVGNKFRWVLSSSDPDLPTTGHRLTFSMASNSALAALGVIGYESIPVTITV